MKISIVGLAAAALLCTSAVAQADPVSITSGGWLNATFEDCGAVTLVSDQFNVHAGWECLNGGFGPSIGPGRDVAGLCRSLFSRPRQDLRHRLRFEFRLGEPFWLLTNPPDRQRDPPTRHVDVNDLHPHLVPHLDHGLG